MKWIDKWARGYVWLSFGAKALVMAALVMGNAGCPDYVRQAGLRAIDDVKAKGGTADDARAAVEAVKAKWTPIWEAWAALRIAEDAWADALEQGADTTGALVGLRSAYCQFMARWPSTVPVIPLAPVICGGVG
jgi:heme exporter protein D